MTAQAQAPLVTVTVDGHSVQVPAGTNIIEVAAKVKKEIPHYCYHPKLSVAGNCRMCLVEMGMPMKDKATNQVVLDAEGKAKIAWGPKPVIGCATQAADGMHIRTDSALIKGCQEGVLEFLLVNHPLDCPICDQAGECRLQEFATDYGKGYSRFVEDKNVKPKRTVLGPRVTLDDERCILCSRCIRFMSEVAKDDCLGFIDRGSYSTLTCYPGKELKSNYSLNTVDICPVGALTSTDFRFKMRVWFLKRTRSICTESSIGTNTEVWSREGTIHRITPRRNDAVNDTWMTDSGRTLYKVLESPNRLTEYSLNQGRASYLESIQRASTLMKSGSVAYVVSASQSLEELFVLEQIRQHIPGSVHAVYHQQADDGLLTSKDARPNTRGLLVSGLMKTLPASNLQALQEAIAYNRVQTIFVYNEDLATCGIPAGSLKNLSIIYLGTHTNATSRTARVQIPTLTVFEKSGSFINQQFRLQTFEQAVPGPAGVMPDIYALHKLLEVITGTHSSSACSLEHIWQQMTHALPMLSTHTFRSIPHEGTLIDGSAFKDLPFCEGSSLHFKPTLAC